MIELIGAPPILVAHRGYPAKYPENTLLSYRQAYRHGARYLELDLQLTRDRVPVLHHDVSLLRMAGVNADIRDTTAADFKSMPAAYAQRFGSQFADNRFTTFKKFCSWLKGYPEVTVFVEIKQESIERFGLEDFVDEVYARIQGLNVARQCVMISFNNAVIEYTRNISRLRTGWVLPAWTPGNKSIVAQLEPDYLFCDKAWLPPGDHDLWHGKWQWAIYNLDDVESAISMANRGIAILETNQIGLLMSDSRLAKKE